MTNEEKMLAGKVYDSSGDPLLSQREKAHRLCIQFNQLTDFEVKERQAILKELLPNMKEGGYLQGPINFDYGKNCYFGEHFYANFNFVVLDSAPITIGDDTFIGCNVTLVTPVHPFLSKDRNTYINEEGVRTDREYAKPITIGSNCWIASNVVVVGGVKIDEGCVIGAGSVVVKDIPSHSLAAGNPCRVIRQLGPKDSLANHPELFC